MLEWIEQHQAILTWLGGGVATVAGGAWVVVRYTLDRKSASAVQTDGRAIPRSRTTATRVSTDTGIAAVGDVQVGGDVIIQHGRLPRAAIALGVLGLLLLAYAAFNSGSRIEVRNGAYVGGNVSDSKISVTPSK
jgi:hypothetical protein